MRRENVWASPGVVDSRASPPSGVIQSVSALCEHSVAPSLDVNSGEGCTSKGRSLARGAARPIRPMDRKQPEQRRPRRTGRRER